ncbi:peptidase inhibitor family I36 protein [Micromonospora vinacea]|uniref:peptidase inhibitor family I36 protein n=1 Tax=Micromonospora vinacea TaxID=709878 RepID=UPI003CF0B2BB
MSLAVGALASVTIASPAQAAKSRCSSTGWLCMWSASNYSGTFSYIDPAGDGSSDGSCHRFAFGTVRSAYNRAIPTYRFYSGTNCTGSSVALVGYASSANFGFNAQSMRDVGF